MSITIDYRKYIIIIYNYFSELLKWICRSGRQENSISIKYKIEMTIINWNKFDKSVSHKTGNVKIVFFEEK